VWEYQLTHGPGADHTAAEAQMEAVGA
jgi:hypothetical protein